MGNIKLSICCVTYNHEKYLKEALDGILMQKVNFDYEVIISDDCSTDNSQKIIEEYIPLFGDKITVFLGEKNIGANKNYDRVQLCSKGEYAIVLETDDKWTDPYKLQKQVDYLDAHPDVIAVAHRCTVINNMSKPQRIMYPECKKKKYTLRQFRKWIMPGQTATIMYRNYHCNNIGVDSCFISRCSELGPGDRAKVFALLSQGKIYCIPEVMSEYRLVTNEGSSFSATNRLKYKDYISYFKEFVQFSKNKNLPMEFSQTAKMLYLEAIDASFFVTHEITWEEKKYYMQGLDHKAKLLIYIGQHVLRVITNKIIGRITGNEYI